MKATLDTQTQTQTLFTELDYRENDGIEVSLLWSRATDKLTVLVCDTRTDESFELAADPTRARDIFNHPYAYAARLAA
jgi:hypothetical protein